MAKKKAAQQQVFVDPETGEEMKEKIPKPVQDKVDLYIDAMRAKNDAQAEVNSAKDACIEAMKKHNIARVRIDEGAKWLVCEDVPHLKTQKIDQEREAA